MLFGVEFCVDLSSRQSMLLMQVAHVHLIFGQELLHRLLVLLSLLLFFLLENRVSGDSEEQNEISAVRICEQACLLFSACFTHRLLASCSSALRVATCISNWDFSCVSFCGST